MENNPRLRNTQSKKNFKVSNAALDFDTLDENWNDAVSIWVMVDGKHTLLANLSRNIPQAQIDVAFGKDQVVNFFMKAGTPASVHLSGYYIFEEEVSDDDASHGEGQFSQIALNERSSSSNDFKNAYAAHNLNNRFFMTDKQLNFNSIENKGR